MVAEPDTIQHVVDVVRQAADANRRTPSLRGNVIHLTAEAGDDVVVTADLHGHRLNFNRLREIADLPSHPRRHWVVQEVCHGGPSYPDMGGCMSHLLLEDIAALKVQFPERFHFLLGNHELAELNDHLITKSGQMLNLHFRAGLQALYGDRARDVRDAYSEFLHTCPVALRTDSGVFVCHGSPDSVNKVGFDAGVLSRPLTDEDLGVGGDVFRMVWGRDFSPENAEAFARSVGAQVLIHGHEPCCDGFAVPNHRQVILDCCGVHGCYAILPVAGKLSHDDVANRIRRIFGKGDVCPARDLPNGRKA
jgi:hypothetical protein